MITYSVKLHKTFKLLVSQYLTRDRILSSVNNLGLSIGDRDDSWSEASLEVDKIGSGDRLKNLDVREKSV